MTAQRVNIIQPVSNIGATSRGGVCPPMLENHVSSHRQNALFFVKEKHK